MENEIVNKIIELDIDIDGIDDELLEEYGVEVISLVDDPAIGVDFHYFKALDDTDDEYSFTHPQFGILPTLKNGVQLKINVKKDIYLISCSSEKLDRKAKACELYDSSLFKKSLEYAQKKVSDDQIYILSAKYHIIPLNKVIEPYDVTLNDMPYTERQDWADKVYSQMEKLFNVHSDKFHFMAGTSYTEYLLDRFKYKRDILEGKKIGERMAWLDTFYAVFNKELDVKPHTFSLNEDKRIATGPLMIPNKMIHRRDEDGGVYYIYFTKDTIRRMAEKFLRLNKHNNTDVDHDFNITTNNTLLESWISEDMMYDKAYKMGFALPMGTWYVSYKINDDETWKRIKNGELKGFSLAGPFIEKMAVSNYNENLLNDIKRILSKIDD